MLDAAWEGNTDEVQRLIDQGADVNAKGDYGWIALHHAAMHGHEATVQVLLDNGAHVDAETDGGKTALDFAKSDAMRHILTTHAAAKKKAEAEAAATKKKAEDDAAAAKKKADDEAAAKKKADEDAAAKKKAEAELMEQLKKATEREKRIEELEHQLQEKEKEEVKAEAESADLKRELDEAKDTHAAATAKAEAESADLKRELDEAKDQALEQGRLFGKEEMLRGWAQHQEGLAMSVLAVQHEAVGRRKEIQDQDLKERCLLACQVVEEQHQISLAADETNWYKFESLATERHRVIFDAFEEKREMLAEETLVFCKFQISCLAQEEAITRHFLGKNLGESYAVGLQEIAFGVTIQCEEQQETELLTVISDRLIARSRLLYQEDQLRAMLRRDLDHKIDPSGQAAVLKAQLAQQQQLHEEQLAAQRASMAQQAEMIELLKATLTAVKAKQDATDGFELPPPTENVIATTGAGSSDPRSQGNKSGNGASSRSAAGSDLSSGWDSVSESQTVTDSEAAGLVDLMSTNMKKSKE